MPSKLIEKLFILAGLSNILGVLICSKFFTNHVMMDAQPAVMGLFGLISIVLWGLAYISVHKTYAHVPWLIAIFVVEKLAYVVAWLIFMSQNSLSQVYESNMLAGIFYTIYGVNDFAFMLFFGYVFFKIKKS